jgi:hypothetical protein
MACSALSKGLNFAVAVASVTIKDILCRVEKVIGALPEQTAEIRQETVRILKVSRKPKDNLTGAKRRALQALKTNEVPTVLPADKGNAAMILDTSDYNQKIAALLEDNAYKELKKDPTDSVECKTVLLLKKSRIAEVSQELQPQGSRPPSPCGLPKIHKPNVPVRLIVRTVGSLTCCLAGLLSTHTGNSPCHMRTSVTFFHTLRSLQIGPHDIMVGFDVASPFTRTPIKDTMDLLG